jgi:hypothetical protein
MEAATKQVSQVFETTCHAGSRQRSCACPDRLRMSVPGPSSSNRWAPPDDRLRCVVRPSPEDTHRVDDAPLPEQAGARPVPVQHEAFDEQRMTLVADSCALGERAAPLAVSSQDEGLSRRRRRPCLQVDLYLAADVGALRTYSTGHRGAGCRRGGCAARLTPSDRRRTGQVRCVTSLICVVLPVSMVKMLVSMKMAQAVYSPERLERTAVKRRKLGPAGRVAERRPVQVSQSN